MKKIILFIIAILSFSQIYAQSKYAYIKFDKTSDSIANIHEENGIISRTFKFTNTGNTPLFLTRVSSSTSRINIIYPTRPILPNQAAEILIKFNPTQQEGAFSRNITVISNAKNRITVINIKGNIITKPISVEEEYPTLVNNIRYRRNNNRLYLNDVKNSEIKTDTVFLMNDTNEEINLEFRNIADFIKIKPMKLTLSAKAKAQILISLDGSGKKDYGYMYERLQLYVNGIHKYVDDLSINANIIEDFSKLSKEEIANAPKLVFESTRYDFGTIKEGEITKHTFKFTNKGKNDLIIRKIKTSCGCTAVTSEKKLIKGGQKSEIDIEFNSINKKGRQHKYIHVICNDPINHTIKLEVIGNIIVSEDKED